MAEFYIKFNFFFLKICLTLFLIFLEKWKFYFSYCFPRYAFCNIKNKKFNEFFFFNLKFFSPQNDWKIIVIGEWIKARLNILSLALSWALWCCLCRTHVILLCVEPPLNSMVTASVMRFFHCQARGRWRQASSVLFTHTPLNS